MGLPPASSRVRGALSTIRFRVTLLAMLVLVISVAGLAWLAAHVLRRELQTTLSHQQFAIASSIADSLDEAVRTRLDYLRATADALPPAILADPAQLGAWMQGRTVIDQLFNLGVFVLSREGKVLAEQPARGRVGADFSDADYLRDALATGAPAIGKARIGRLVPKPVVTFAVPVLDGHGGVGAVLAGSNIIVESTLFERLMRTHQSEHAIVTVISLRDRIFVTSSDPKRVLQPIPSSSASGVVARFLEGTEGSAVVMNSEGTEMLSSAKRVPSAGWLVICSLPTEEAFASIAALERRIYLGALVMVLLVGSLFWVVISRELNPLVRSAELIAGMGAGAVHQQRLPVGGGREITTLQTAFNGLQEKLLRRESEQRRLYAAVEQAPTSVMITDLAGRIEYVNPAFERVSGYSRADVLGRNPSLLKSGAQSEETYRRLWETISAGQIWRGKLVNKTRAGALYTENAVIAPVKDEQGAVCNYVAVKQDITEELLLQERLSASQRLESIGRLAGGVAHDFNNLLTVILGSGEALQEDLASGLKPDAEDIAQILSASRRAGDLTRQLLAFARRGVLAPVALDLNAVVTRSRTLLQRVLGEDIALEVELQPDLWPVRCDPVQVEQVILNLSVNARDAMPRGGKLTISTRNSTEPAEPSAGVAAQPAEWARLTVRDTGVGMPPEVLAHIFEPFFTTKEVGKGTGLGLATVHGIVAQAGGHLRVESEPGRGTLFEVSLPRTLQAAPAAGPVGVAAPTRGNETILLIEDDPHVRGVTATALRRGGYRVVAAGDGQEALAIFSRDCADVRLVVTDVVMPGLDGRTVADALQRRRPGLRVLFVSGYSNDVISHHGVLDLGIAFLQKPFSTASLLERVRAMLDA